MKQNIAIIIPAYNESKNIPVLLKKIILHLPNAKVVIVDDSNKEQNKLLRSILNRKKFDVQLVSRGSKLGRGNAVLAGFAEALKDKHIDYFFEMDADLSHDPSECKVLLEKIKTVDLVIGSRYLTGSHIRKWPLRRLILSRIVNIFLNIWLGLSLSDYTNGFRLYRRRVVEFLIIQKLKESGFIALSESAYKIKRAGFSIAEVSTTFTDREYGKSSAGIWEHASSLLGAVRIRLS